MTEKRFNTRLINKHDIEANWKKATGFIPKAGEMIVYDTDDNYNYSRIKIGDGVSNVNDLLFTSDTLAYSKYGEPIILDTDNTTIKYPNLNLIGSKVIDEAPGRRRLKTPLTKPEAPCAIADNEYLSINYLNMDMFNKYVLMLISEQFPMFCPSLSPNTFGVFYTFEDVALNTNAGPVNRLFCKANSWYSVEIPENENDIIKIEPFDLEKNPITLPSFSEVNNYFYECTEAADIIEYTITHEHILYDDNSCIINNQTIHQDYTRYSDSLLILLYLLSSTSFIYQNDSEIQLQQLSLGNMPSRTKLTIIPLLENKQIDSNYIQLAQPDYQQNDITKPDYIKNRLAYTDYESIQLFDINVVNKNANGLLEYTTEEYPLFLQEGKTYLVNDSNYSNTSEFTESIEYVCEKITIENIDYYTIGNPAVLPGGANITSTSNIQWCIAEQKIDNEFAGWGIFFGDNEKNQSEVRMQLGVQEEVVHPVPEKYIMPTLEPVIVEFATALDGIQTNISVNEDKITNIEEAMNATLAEHDELLKVHTGDIQEMSMQTLLNNYTDQEGTLTWNGIIDNKEFTIVDNEDNMIFGYTKIADGIIPSELTLAMNMNIAAVKITALDENDAVGGPMSIWMPASVEYSEEDNIVLIIPEDDESKSIFIHETGVYVPTVLVNGINQSIIYISGLLIPGYSFKQSNDINILENTVSISNNNSIISLTNPEKFISVEDGLGFQYWSIDIMPSIEELKNSNIYWITNNGRCYDARKYPESDISFSNDNKSMVINRSWFPGLIVIWDESYESSSIEEGFEKGVYVFGNNITTILPSNLIYIENGNCPIVHDTIKKELLPKELRLGNNNIIVNNIKTTQQILGNTIVVSENNWLYTDETHYKWNRISDILTSIEENTEILATFEDGTTESLYYSDNTLWNEDKTIVYGVNHLSTTDTYTFQISEPGFYVYHLQQDCGDNYKRNKKITELYCPTYEFTTTIYSVEETTTTEFKKLDAQYLPDTNLIDLRNYWYDAQDVDVYDLNTSLLAMMMYNDNPLVPNPLRISNDTDNNLNEFWDAVTNANYSTKVLIDMSLTGSVLAEVNINAIQRLANGTANGIEISGRFIDVPTNTDIRFTASFSKNTANGQYHSTTIYLAKENLNANVNNTPVAVDNVLLKDTVTGAIYKLEMRNGNLVSSPVGIPCESIELIADWGDIRNQELEGSRRESMTLIAKLTPENTTDTVIWSSSDTDVAIVENGLVTGVFNLENDTGEATAIITATCGNQQASYTIKVSDGEFPLDIL